jgi:hypothetical protein
MRSPRLTAVQVFVLEPTPRDPRRSARRSPSPIGSPDERLRERDRAAPLGGSISRNRPSKEVAAPDRLRKPAARVKKAQDRVTATRGHPERRRQARGGYLLNCPRCWLAIAPRAPWLSITYCPRCLARSHIIVELVRSHLPAETLHAEITRPSPTE